MTGNTDYICTCLYNTEDSYNSHLQLSRKDGLRDTGKKGQMKQNKHRENLTGPYFRGFVQENILFSKVSKISVNRINLEAYSGARNNHLVNI